MRSSHERILTGLFEALHGDRSDAVGLRLALIARVLDGEEDVRQLTASERLLWELARTIPSAEQEPSWWAPPAPLVERAVRLGHAGAAADAWRVVVGLVQDALALVSEPAHAIRPVATRGGPAPADGAAQRTVAVSRAFGPVRIELELQPAGSSRVELRARAEYAVDRVDESAVVFESASAVANIANRTARVPDSSLARLDLYRNDRLVASAPLSREPIWVASLEPVDYDGHIKLGARLAGRLSLCVTRQDSAT